MIALCREKAQREGLSPNLYVQPMHELELPRTYRTIYVCGAFGLGSDRERDRKALERFRGHLDPGGTLLVDAEMPYADARQWGYWPKEERAALPEDAEPPRSRRQLPDGSELGLRSRLLEVDPLEQHLVYEMRAERWRDGVLQEAETHRLDHALYFRNELLLMLERAGFADVVVHGEHEEREATAEDDFLVFVAHKG